MALRVAAITRKKSGRAEIRADPMVNSRLGKRQEATVKKAAERVDEDKKPTSDGGANLGSSASFRRPQPDELLSATARIPKADLDTLLRRESGTRAAVSRDEIARHIEEKLAATELPTAPPPQDPHARPTIDVFPPAASAAPLPSPPAHVPVVVEPPPPSMSLQTPPPVVLTPAHGLILPSRPAPPTAHRPSSSRLIVAAVVAGALVFVSLAIALGFFLGRLTGH